MDIEILKSFIKPELVILIPVLFIIGKAIKNSEIKDKFIPLILGIVSIVLCSLYVYGTTDIANSKEFIMSIFVVITQGVLVAGASVYADQLIKQAKK
jgi:1,4-dihydroxy-2-naphthoate octaprenyltransferase